jgi:hypothetical protein
MIFAGVSNQADASFLKKIFSFKNGIIIGKLRIKNSGIGD